MKNNQTLRAIIVLVLLLVVGAGIMVMNKFQYDTNYSKNVRLEVYLGKNFEIKDMVEATNEIYENQQVIVQKAGPFEDTVAITVKETTEEQKEQLLQKINEKYGMTLTNENIASYYNSNVRGRDLIEPYIGVSIIAGVLILVFFGIRYHKLGVTKVLGSVVGIIVGTQILYLTLTSIFSMKVSNITIASGIAILIFCVMYLSANYEKAIKKAE